MAREFQSPTWYKSINEYCYLCPTNVNYLWCSFLIRMEKNKFMKLMAANHMLENSLWALAIIYIWTILPSALPLVKSAIVYSYLTRSGCTGEFRGVIIENNALQPLNFQRLVQMSTILQDIVLFYIKYLDEARDSLRDKFTCVFSHYDISYTTRQEY